MKLKLNESKIKEGIKLKEMPEPEEFPLRDIDSQHIIGQLEENIKMRETPILERLKAKLKK